MIKIELSEGDAERLLELLTQSALWARPWVAELKVDLADAYKDERLTRRWEEADQERKAR